jgi:hypothetical protein
MYVRYPLSLRNVEELLEEREIDVSYENGSLLVEPLWPDIRGRNPEDAVCSVQRLYPLALVFGCGLREPCHANGSAHPVVG